MSKTQEHNDKRRAFLRGSALLGAGATIVATTPGVAAPRPEVEQATKAAEPESKGYQLTEHVAAYYRSAAS